MILLYFRLFKNDLNNDLQKIYGWAYQWEMKFNPYASKQAQEVIFSMRVSKSFHADVYFNNNPVELTSAHKHLGMILDPKVSFEEHLKSLMTHSIKN